MRMGEMLSESCGVDTCVSRPLEPAIEAFHLPRVTLLRIVIGYPIEPANTMR